MDEKLKEFFNKERWERLIDKAVNKGIDKKLLTQLCEPENRLKLLNAIESGKYAIAPPHIAQIPKDDGSMREVYVNEPIDRIFLSIYNDVMFKLYPHAIHPNCKSYQKGIGCGMVVKELSEKVIADNAMHGSFKADISKYFDSVNIETIEKTLREFSTGSPLDDIIWEYYHNDLVFDVDGNLIHKYVSLKQGCAFASFLANVVLRDVDEALSKLDITYYRYSDDIVCIGKDSKKALAILTRMLDDKGLHLNPKKLKPITADTYFEFLGFNIKGKNITMSKKSLHNFQSEINARSIDTYKGAARYTPEQAIHAINDYLYRTDTEHGFSFSQYFLPVINVTEDIREMDKYIMDAIRACNTGRTHLGGLGINLCNDTNHGHIVNRGKGTNVRHNKELWEEKYGSLNIDGYYTLMCMKNNLSYSKAVYQTVANIAA